VSASSGSESDREFEFCVDFSSLFCSVFASSSFCGVMIGSVFVACVSSFFFFLMVASVSVDIVTLRFVRVSEGNGRDTESVYYMCVCMYYIYVLCVKREIVKKRDVVIL